MVLAPTGIVPKPPTAFATHVTDLPVGAVLWRIHAEKLAGNVFNPGFGASRFAPIGPVRKRVPTAYAAQEFEAAVYETIFHDLDPAQPFKTYPLSKLGEVRCSVLRVTSPLALRSFLAPDLMKLGLARNQLIDTPAHEFPDTRRWAAALHRKDVGTHGMVWESRAYPSSLAMMFFGDRLPSGALSVVSSTRIDADPVLAMRFRALADRSGVTLIV
ncbi:RES domain-containing protein [Sphingomonas ginsenosidivorax]|uniref:RES domain-containing protein n=1 Tax=Sphingomonas ginsenosidivorax TaxID=862135 RepID=A0A5C6U5K3_9SPHN|nr:RES family NAD+ phosphorylase [Sphingomonas ginsenosidivorax]TXC67930.1 RES domain-containing protein [Sphingomonas ginsenosidivorax]TXC68042.1 RES domain-containing protein [Sphingomonas ginsenosidivorax]